MKWTTDKPTQPGWYWVRWPEHPQYGPEILEVSQPNGPDTDDLCIDPWGTPLDEYIAEHAHVEWQGPLKPIKEQEEVQ